MRRQTASIFGSLSVHIPVCLPDLTAREAILFAENVEIRKCVFKLHSKSLGAEEYSPHHVIIHTLEYCEATENVFLPNYVDGVL